MKKILSTYRRMYNRRFFYQLQLVRKSKVSGIRPARKSEIRRTMRAMKVLQSLSWMTIYAGLAFTAGLAFHPALLPAPDLLVWAIEYIACNVLGIALLVWGSHRNLHLQALMDLLKREVEESK